jgi:hypothetical protein
MLLSSILLKAENGTRIVNKIVAKEAEIHINAMDINMGMTIPIKNQIPAYFSIALLNNIYQSHRHAL